MKTPNPTKVVIVPRPPANGEQTPPENPPAAPAQGEEIQPEEVGAEECQPTEIVTPKKD
ncbi:MAG: hypothetical protein II851_06740 [Bacteroidales bacterium]|nr:hypothetical protein [Bacteroidales bacterium]